MSFISSIIKTRGYCYNISRFSVSNFKNKNVNEPYTPVAHVNLHVTMLSYLSFDFLWTTQKENAVRSFMLMRPMIHVPDSQLHWLKSTSSQQLELCSLVLRRCQWICTRFITACLWVKRCKKITTPIVDLRGATLDMNESIYCLL